VENKQVLALKLKEEIKVCFLFVNIFLIPTHKTLMGDL